MYVYVRFCACVHGFSYSAAPQSCMPSCRQSWLPMYESMCMDCACIFVCMYAKFRSFSVRTLRSWCLSLGQSQTIFANAWEWMYACSWLCVHTKIQGQVLAYVQQIPNDFSSKKNATHTHTQHTHTNNTLHGQGQTLAYVQQVPNSFPWRLPPVSAQLRTWQGLGNIPRNLLWGAARIKAVSEIRSRLDLEAHNNISGMKCLNVSLERCLHEESVWDKIRSGFGRNVCGMRHTCMRKNCAHNLVSVNLDVHVRTWRTSFF
jgi:hypothetical protein